MKEERLKHVARIRVSNVDKKSTEGDSRVRLCNYTDVYYNERITGSLEFMSATATRDQCDAFGLRQGDVIITKDSETAGDIGISALVAENVPELVCGYHLALVRPRIDRTDGRYLRWVLASTLARQRMSAAATGVTRFGLRSEAIADLPVPRPPIAAQRAIADYLDRETDRIDALIAATERMSRLLAERWETLRISLVCGSDGSAEPLRKGPEWLGCVPGNWPIERLKFLARMESGHTPDRTVDAYWVDCTIPWITLNDVGTLQREWTITESANAINELGMANSAAHILPAATVVLSRDATVGRAAILGQPMTVSQHFVGWICGPRLAPEYLLHVLRGPMQRHFATLTAGATIATIGMPELNDLVIPVPSVDAQARIVTKLRSAEDQFERARAALDSRVSLLLERRQSLITAAVTGQLDLPNAT